MTARPASLHVAWPSVIWMAAIHIGALLVFLPAYFSWSGVVLCLLLHWLTGGIGICMTYHRLLTHRSFTLRPKWLEYPLTIVGAMASEGGEIGWVADIAGIMPSRTTRTTRTPRLRAFSGRTWSGGCWLMTRRCTRRSTTRDGRLISKRTRFTAGSTNITSFSDRAHGHALLPGRDELAGVGRLLPHGTRAPYHLAGEFR